MNEHENIIRDFRCLKLILNLDFLNNLLSLISIFGCTFLVALSWNESNYLALVLQSQLSFIFILAITGATWVTCTVCHCLKSF